jgi:hypothetical protein
MRNGITIKTNSTILALRFKRLAMVHTNKCVLVNDQLDAQFFFSICLFQFSTCFEQPRAHHQENQLYQYNIWCVSLCKQVNGLK